MRTAFQYSVCPGGTETYVSLSGACVSLGEESEDIFNIERGIGYMNLASESLASEKKAGAKQAPIAAPYTKTVLRCPAISRRFDADVSVLGIRTDVLSQKLQILALSSDEISLIDLK